VVFGVFIALQENAYVTSYPTLASRVRVAATFGSNAGTNVLFGPSIQLQTVGGFTQWKCIGIFSVLGAIWALLLSTKLLRGEEEAGRWELLLAGQTTRDRATLQVILGSCSGLVALFAIAAIFAAALGHSPKIAIGVPASLLFAVACVASAAMFLGIGALVSQLAPTRRQAASYAAGALGTSFVVRMVADTGSHLAWLRWLSPLGWVEEIQPLTHAQPLALLPIVALVVISFGLSVRLAKARDLDTSVIAERAHAIERTRLLGGPWGLSLRLTRGVLTGWALGIVAFSLILGLVAKSASSALGGSASVTRYYGRLGIHGVTTSDYLGLALLIVSVLVAFAAVGQVTAMRGEESTGRLEPLLVRPVSRGVWLVGRGCIAIGALVGFGLLIALATWTGAISQGAQVHFTGLLEGGINVVPPALCLFGIGVLGLGVLPRATVFVGYGALGWSFLIDVIGGAVNINHWVLDTSVFHEMAAVPAVNPNWTSGAAMIGIGVIAALTGGIAFSRRDLAGD
jgi:ABC-2 type transport system permease protein